MYANYDLYKIPYIKIDSVEKLDMAHDGFIVMDEFWQYLDSRASASTRNRVTSNILLRSRKRDLTYCLLPEEDIMTNSGVKKISDIKIGDYVLTHTGTFKKVLQLHKRKYNGNIFKITPRRLCLGVNLTENHKIFTENGEKRAGELNYNDKLIYPIIKETKDINFLKISDFHKEKIIKNLKRGVTSELINLDYDDIKKELVKRGWNKRLAIKLGWYIKTKAKKNGKIYGWRLYGDKWFYSRFDSECNNIIKIDNNFMEFMGYFLSDGSTSIGCGDITIAFGLKEYEYAKRTQELFKTVFGTKSILSKRNGFNIYTVRCSSVPISNFLRQIFGTNSHDKHVPEWFLTLPKEKQKIFLDAYIVGDGSINKKRNCVSIVTVSKHLVFAIIQMLLRNGIYATIVKTKSNGYGNKNKKLKHFNYYIIYYLSNKKRIGEIKDDKLILPIKNIEKRKYKGFVYNIGIEKDHSYTTFSFVTKNCFTSQMLDLLDKRVRKILDFTAYTILNPQETVAKTLIFRGGYPKEGMILKTMRFYAHGVFQLYSTNQEINMIEDDGQPPKIIFQESPQHPPKYFDDWESADKFAEKYWSKNLELLSLLMAGQ